MQNKKDLIILFSTRMIRLFSYGFLSVILAIYLSTIGLSNFQIGLLFSLTLLGDVVVSMWVTTKADQLGRKRMLILGSILMCITGIIFVFCKNPIALTIVAIIGIISPSGNEIGPFLSIEQASLSQIITNKKRTWVFSWYNLAGSFTTAMGALCSGWFLALLKNLGVNQISAFRCVLSVYSLAGFLLLLLFANLSIATETKKSKPENKKIRFGLHRSHKVVFKLSSLFAFDAFAGGFVIQSMIAYWFHIKFGADAETLGSIFFGANILAGISALMASRIAKMIGLLNTMVLTHLPSNILLILVPLMPNLPLAATMLLLRFSISQMDVPTRNSYTMAVVEEDERTAASGITNTARSIGASASPVLLGLLFSNPLLLSIPFFISGGLKIVYDLSLLHMFKHIKPPEEL